MKLIPDPLQRRWLRLHHLLSLLSNSWNDLPNQSHDSSRRIEDLECNSVVKPNEAVIVEWGNKVNRTNVEINFGTNVDRGD